MDLRVASAVFCLALVWFPASAQDPDLATQEAAAGSGERYYEQLLKRKLAEQFREQSFANEAIRKQALDTLLGEAAAREVLAKEFQDALGNDLQAVIDDPSDDVFSKQWALWRTHLKSLMEEDRLAEFEALIPSSKWFAADSEEETGKLSREQWVWNGFFDGFSVGPESVSETDRDHYERILMKLESNPMTQRNRSTGQRRKFANADWYRSSRYAGMRLALEVARGVEKPGEGWLESFPAVFDPQKEASNHYSIAQRYLWTARQFSPARAGALEERLREVAVLQEANLPV